MLLEMKKLVCSGLLFLCATRFLFAEPLYRFSVVIDADLDNGVSRISLSVENSVIRVENPRTGIEKLVRVKGKSLDRKLHLSIADAKALGLSNGSIAEVGIVQFQFSGAADSSAEGRRSQSAESWDLPRRKSRGIEPEDEEEKSSRMLREQEKAAEGEENTLNLELDGNVLAIPLPVERNRTVGVSKPLEKISSEKYDRFVYSRGDSEPSAEENRVELNPIEPQTKIGSVGNESVSDSGLMDPIRSRTDENSLFTPSGSLSDPFPGLEDIGESGSPAQAIEESDKPEHVTVGPEEPFADFRELETAPGSGLKPSGGVFLKGGDPAVLGENRDRTENPVGDSVIIEKNRIEKKLYFPVPGDFKPPPFSEDPIKSEDIYRKTFPLDLKEKEDLSIDPAPINPDGTQRVLNHQRGPIPSTVDEHNFKIVKPSPDLNFRGNPDKLSVEPIREEEAYREGKHRKSTDSPDTSPPKEKKTISVMGIEVCLVEEMSEGFPLLQGYYIQAAAFKDVRKTEVISEELSAYPLNVIFAVVEGEKFYRCLFGPLSEKQLEKALKDVKRLGHQDAFVYKVVESVK